MGYRRANYFVKWASLLDHFDIKIENKILCKIDYTFLKEIIIHYKNPKLQAL